MQRKIALALLVLLTLGFNSGCGSGLGNVEKPLPPPMQIRVACPSGRAQAVMNTQGILAAKRHNLDLKLVSRIEDQLPQGEDAEADIWVIRPDELGEFASKSLLAPAPETLRQLGNPISWDDFFPLYREKTVIWNRRVFALPLLGEGQVCFYRADLYDEPSRQSEYKKKFNEELKPPQSWGEWIKQAKHFASTGVNQGKTLSPLPESNADLVREFFTISAGYCRRPVALDETVTAEVEESIFSFVYEANTGAPLISGPGFVKGLIVLKEMNPLRAKGEAGNNPLLSGTPVLALGDSALAGWVQQTKSLRDKYNFSPVPGANEVPFGKKGEFRLVQGGNKIPFLGQGGYLTCVNAKSKNANLAFSYLEELASPRISERIAMEPSNGGFLRFTQLSRMRMDAFELDATQTEALRVALKHNLIHADIKNPAMASSLPGNAKRRDALALEIRSFLEGKTTEAQSALDKAAARWKEIDQAWPEKEFKALVKIAAGLIPD